MDRKRNDDDLAYGQDHRGPPGEDEAAGQRGLLSDVYGRLAHRPAQGNAPEGSAPQGSAQGQVSSPPCAPLIGFFWTGP
jgi:hypothetical protein